MIHKYYLKRLALVLILVGIIACYILFDLGRFLSLEYLKSSRESFQALYNEHTFFVLAGYFMLYVLTTAFALPAATVISLAGGALFGLATGVFIVSFASTIGATLAFIMSRYLFRDWVQDKFGERLKKINEGVEREGAFYLFTLRLIPAIPFFVINTVMALTPMRLFTFYWVSQVGMFPATVIYINAGKELGQLESLSGLFSPSLIISFIILGLFPLVMKKTLSWIQARR
ncbi:TVP38/TMEM64 family protein [Pseudodesulfovibrio piezophilus]|uniref:TVP38/TMEM64 family membrane protein n=1 Tax=Pseudodesulfovibrio piezophilus (strain DSM 21447 / JCM 15486 / C1TLV30) TaxID=1322246 RepID=M1WUJ9_PSEP2|nr:TVP38/TMEM64 family protein [Pseudodesulfovibrio piezophilus]CCH47468.1 SNARE associated Golgi protein [Pseudodesulfovibrio piezophilus C1TLV30]